MNSMVSETDEKCLRRVILDGFKALNQIGIH